MASKLRYLDETRQWSVVNGSSVDTPLTLTPTANTLIQGLNVTQSASGTLTTGPSEYGLNNINITSDNSNISGGTALEINALLVNYTFGGVAAQGGRNGIFSILTQTAATGSTNPLNDYVAIDGAIVTTSGDGGTNTGAGAKGAYFGGNFQARSSAANTYQLCGIEADIYGTAVATQKYVTCYSASSLHVNQGATLDAAYEIHSGTSSPFGPGGGFHYGLVFAELNNGLPPIDVTGTLIGTHLESLGTLSVANGIDLTGCTFSNTALESTGFSVDPIGIVKILSTTAIPAGGTAGQGIKFSSAVRFGIFFGSGAPTLQAAKGSLYLRSDGTTTNDRMYIKTDGSTTWTS